MALKYLLLDDHYRTVNLTLRLIQEHDMNTYAVGVAHLQALLTSIADESEMMFLAPVALSPRERASETHLV